MATTTSARLVIDASVAAAAGQTLHPTSRRSREFLDAVLKICHRVVMSPDLIHEWELHESQFSAAWRAEMRSKRKVIDLPGTRNSEVRNQLAAQALSHTMRRAAEKDLHLVEAAIETDKIVVSLDDHARELLRMDATAKIAWVNAVAEGGDTIYWLRRGAKPLKKWRLTKPRSST